MTDTSMAQTTDKKAPGLDRNQYNWIKDVCAAFKLPFVDAAAARGATAKTDLATEEKERDRKIAKLKKAIAKLESNPETDKKKIVQYKLKLESLQNELSDEKFDRGKIDQRERNIEAAAEWRDAHHEETRQEMEQVRDLLKALEQDPKAKIDFLEIPEFGKDDGASNDDKKITQWSDEVAAIKKLYNDNKDAMTKVKGADGANRDVPVLSHNEQVLLWTLVQCGEALLKAKRYPEVFAVTAEFRDKLTAFKAAKTADLFKSEDAKDPSVGQIHPKHSAFLKLHRQVGEAVQKLTDLGIGDKDLTKTAKLHKKAFDKIVAPDSASDPQKEIDALDALLMKITQAERTFVAGLTELREELKAQAAQIKSKVDEFIQHDRKGKAKTTEDHKTGDTHIKPKNFGIPGRRSHVPTEYLEGLLAQVETLELLAGSESKTAMAQALNIARDAEARAAQMDKFDETKMGHKEVKKFKVWHEAEKHIKDVNKVLTDSTTFMTYVRGEDQADYQQRLSDFKDAYLTQTPEEAAPVIAKLVRDVAQAKINAKDIKELSKTFEKQRDATRKLLDGDYLKAVKAVTKKHKEDSAPDSNHYYGDKYLTIIKSQEARAKRYTEYKYDKAKQEIKDATSRLETLDDDIKDQTDRLQRYSGMDDLNQIRQQRLDDLVGDAKDGDTAHIDNLTLKEKFKKDRDALKALIKFDKQSFKKHELGIDTLLALESKLDVLKVKAADSDDYAAALDEIAEINEEYLEERKLLDRKEGRASSDLPKLIRRYGSRITKFKAKLGKFHDTYIKDTAAELEANNGDPELIKACGKSRVNRALEPVTTPLSKGLDDLETAADILQNVESGKDARLRAREDCLRVLRLHRGYLSSGQPALHYEDNPFDKGAAILALRSFIQQLEVKVQTEIKVDSKKDGGS